MFFYVEKVPSNPQSKSPPKMIPFHGWAMIDSGASSCFLHQNLIDKYCIPTHKKAVPRHLRIIDGHDISSGLIEYECTISIYFGSHKEELSCNVTNIGHHEIVLGMSWLKKHSPSIEWSSK